MPNKFTLVGSVKEVKQNESLLLHVRRNYRNRDGEYDFDEFNVAMSLGLSNTMVNNLKTGELVSVFGRIEQNSLKNLMLIAEQIDRIDELNPIIF